MQLQRLPRSQPATCLRRRHIASHFEHATDRSSVRTAHTTVSCEPQTAVSFV